MGYLGSYLTMNLNSFTILLSSSSLKTKVKSKFSPDFNFSLIPNNIKWLFPGDKTNGELKEVTNLKIQGHNNEEVYIYQTLDSIGIPLKNSDNLTIYSLTKDFNENTSNSGNKDDLYINYSYNWEYISRACGFKTTYELKNLIIENDSNNWILDTELINNNIINEKSIHVKIFH